MIAHAHDTYGTPIPHIHLYPTPVSFEQCDQRPLFYSYNNRSYNKFSFSKARYRPSSVTAGQTQSARSLSAGDPFSMQTA